MAKFDTLVPHLLRWEVGYTGVSNDPKAVYTAAAKRGYHCIAGDKGGPTMCGVTLATYRTYCRKHGLKMPTVADLKMIPFEHWYDISKGMFWDKAKADQMLCNAHAWVIVDWMYTAGTNAIKSAQRALGVTADGIVGAETLAALNGGDHRETFAKLQAARESYYRRVARRGSNARFLRGWLNRTRSITFTTLR